MSDQIYQLKVSLKGLIPPIWRTFQVSGQTNLAELHRVIQAVMGWTEQHCYRFVIAGVAYGDPATNEWSGVLPAGQTRLQDVCRVGDRFIYIYDLAADWQHVLRVEQAVAPRPDKIYPVCLAGQRACPPENCGGIWPYSDLLALRHDPQHEDHLAALEFLGANFDPDAFSLTGCNAALARTVGRH